MTKGISKPASPRITISEGKVVKGGVIPSGKLPNRPAAPAPNKTPPTSSGTKK